MEPSSTRSVQIPEAYLRFEAEIRNRERHLDILVVTWIVLGISCVVCGIGGAALVVFAAGSAAQAGDPALRVVMPIVAVLILVGLSGMGLWYLLTAWGLHRRRQSARFASYVLAGLLAVTICFLPLALYAFWLLVGQIADMAFGRYDRPPGERPGAAPGPAREQEGPRTAEVLPPRVKRATPGYGSYPIPAAAARTPPAGIHRYYREGPQVPPADHKDISTMTTVSEMPAPGIHGQEPADSQPGSSDGVGGSESGGGHSEGSLQ